MIWAAPNLVRAAPADTGALRPDAQCTPCEALDETREKIGRFEEACEAGEGAGCAAVAHAYWGPPYCCLPERPPERVTALLLLNRSCSLGHDAGCEQLFRLTVYPERAEDIQTVKRACDAGVAAACHGYAEYLARIPTDDPKFRGAGFQQGLRRLMAKAAPYHRRACELGHHGACAQHAVRLTRGTGQAPDAEAGFALLRATCAEHRRAPQRWFDGSLACSWLGDALWQGRGVVRNKTRARQVWHEACRLDGNACDRLPILGWLLGDVARWLVWILQVLALVAANAVAVYALMRPPRLSPKMWRLSSLGLAFVVALAWLIGLQLVYYFWGHPWQSPAWILAGLSASVLPVFARFRRRGARADVE